MQKISTYLLGNILHFQQLSLILWHELSNKNLGINKRIYSNIEKCLSSNGSLNSHLAVNVHLTFIHVFTNASFLTGEVEDNMANLIVAQMLF